MSALLEQPLGTLIEASATPASDLAEALTIRMAKLTFSIGAAAGRRELLQALSAGSPAQFFRAFVDIFAAHQPHDVRALLLLKGRAEILTALEASGGMWRADDAQQHLQVGRASLQTWRRDKKILALPLPDGSFGYPVAQFAPPDSDLLPPRPYPVVEDILRLAGDRLSSEELFLLLATPQDALAEEGADEWRTGFQCMAAGEGTLVMALVDHVTDWSDDGAPLDTRADG